jgi:hypothetical protein
VAVVRHWPGGGARGSGTRAGHQDDLCGDRLDGQAGTDRLGSGAQGLRPAVMADGQVRDHLGLLPAIGRAARERGDDQVGQGGEWRGVAGPEPDGFLAEPADLV